MAKRARPRTSHISQVAGRRDSANVVRSGYESTTALASAALSSAGVIPDSGASSGELPLYVPVAPGAGQVGGVPIYRGSFIPSDGEIYGDRKCSYTGPLNICEGSQYGRMFMTGYLTDAVAEIAMPTVVPGTDVNALPVATLTQPYKLFVPPDPITDYFRINGLSHISNQLILGATNWYASSNEPKNYGVFSDPSSLSTSQQKGMHQVAGARHNAGWVVPIPPQFQAQLGGTHLQGYGGGVSIQSYAPSGISFYSVNAADILSAPAGGGPVSATVLAYYPLETPMGGNLGTSQMWNFLSRCAYFFFVPGTRTIFCVGQSWDYRVARPNNLIFYKTNETPTGIGTDENGEQWSNGYFAFLPDAYCNYGWAYDVNDLAAVKAGTKAPHTVEPYWHGPLDQRPFDDPVKGGSLLGGAFYDEALNVLFYSSERGAQARFASVPVIGALELAGVGSKQYRLTLDPAKENTAGYYYWSPMDNYAGAFRVPLYPGGHAEGTGFSDACIAYNPTNDSMFVSGHREFRTICEVAIPATLGTATAYANVNTLPIASVIQGLSSFSTRGISSNQAHKIASLYYEDNKLLATVFEHYAQNQSFKNVFCVIRDASNLASSLTDGGMVTAFDSSAGGWCTPIPLEFQYELGATHLMGFSASGGRRSSIQALSLGAAAYGTDVTYLLQNSATFGTSTVPQTRLIRYQYLDYTDDQEIIPTDDLYNWVSATSSIITNLPVWTALSECSYAAIFPKTKSYIVVGKMAMQNSGGWYGNNEGTGDKALPPGTPPHAAFVNQGPHPRTPTDEGYWYWIYDIEQMIQVKKGLLQWHDIMPYEYGPLDLPLDSSPDYDLYIGGGALKQSTNQLFLSIVQKDGTQGATQAPMVLVFNNFRRPT